ncbi:MAG: YceI family protein [Candidatus Komeilibacteria bacterium CG10_big_fil_rev_8_21_14_0_10_41_13]|uniref:YceI family protein n=1 Tax=Candidatus Komeilibacteria bacterium CG10_big_fil_rev_8_21_14_0_10_41_13 TaxID=1974476 RepID=A0A2M6WCD7_9BACT|nr:MAG: YceI family protein [Candidatus Komeilibacteria bacterium CG10_big_fil_rev_8_21_14_0_10_41_13]
MFKYIPLLLIPFLLAGCGQQEQNNPQASVNQEQEVADNSMASDYPEGAEVYTVNLADSLIDWFCKRIWVSTNNHNGNINIKEGSIVYLDDQFVSADFVIDMTTIKDNDLSGQMKETLESHIKSSDFFDVENYPTAVFKATKVEKEAGENNFLITGNLTIKDQTHEIAFPAVVEKTDEQIIASAEFSIDRTKWGVTYQSGNFFEELGEKVIDDMIRFKVDLIAESGCQVEADVCGL